jgi:prepilin peptidase CpaA
MTQIMLVADPIQIAKLSLLAVLVAACTGTDLVSRRIPNVYVASALVIAFVLQGLGDGIAGLLDGLGGLAFGLLILSPLYVAGGMSAGDVKLMGTTGAILGANGAIVAGIATLIAGGLLGMLFIAWRLLEPLISVQIHRLMQMLSNDSRGSPRLYRDVSIRKQTIPYAPAVAAGAFFAMWQINFIAS